MLVRSPEKSQSLPIFPVAKVFMNLGINVVAHRINVPVTEGDVPDRRMRASADLAWAERPLCGSCRCYDRCTRSRYCPYRDLRCPRTFWGRGTFHRKDRSC